MRVYIAGPMSGIPAFNYSAFMEAAAKLRGEGHEVFNPAERDLARDGKDWGKEVASGDPAEAKAKGFDRRRALADDIEYICLHAEAIALLPGWQNSKGARAERATALALGLKVLLL